MLLANIVRTSQEVAETRSRLAKTAALARQLRALSPAEVKLGVSYLMGRLPQGRIGLGGAALRSALHVAPAATAALTLADVDAALQEVEAATGAGSATRRRERLQQLFGRATRDEQDFLARLLIGELRQGALEGIAVEAVAQ